MKKIPLLVFALLAIAFYSCKTDKTKTSDKKKGRQIPELTDAQVKLKADSLVEELDASWSEMMASDDQKIDNLQTLLARIGRDKRFNQVAYTDLVAQKDNLKVKRFKREAIGDVAAVDAYDSAQVKLMDGTYALADEINLASRDTIAGQLANRIQDDDSRVVFFRARYDRAAKNFNQFLQDYRSQLQKIGAPYSEMKPAPMFTPQPVLQ